MSMEELDNNPSGTDSLTEAEAVSKLSGLLNARSNDAVGETDENESEEDSQPQDVAEDTTEEQAEGPSDEVETDTDGEEDDSSEQAETALGDDTQVEVNGNKISLGELKKGHMLHADYTRKTQQHAEEVKAFGAQRDQLVATLRGELAQRADAMAMIANRFALPKPTVQMAQDDPVNYPAAMALWEEQQQAIQGLLVERDNQSRLAAEQNQAFLKQEQARGFTQLLEMHPDLADTAKGEAEIRSLWAYGTKIFGEELLGSVADARMFSVLRKAELYDRNMAQQGKVKQQVANKPALAKPGTSSPGAASTNQQERARAMARLNKSGSVEDAIAALKLASKRK